ncbi:Protein of unknown function [Pyronema omphalodes CBS 100304]|uniref:Uncharacterized protein n=1 Tax=Pyronema omphalodes (strain CBS 100304) TaxID=1076935 RepID=U4LDY0_PYROM|nr:Protein of unknown function [Pyronema omphalodes CBS 100304]
MSNRADKPCARLALAYSGQTIERITKSVCAPIHGHSPARHL